MVHFSLIEESTGEVLQLPGTLGCTGGKRPRDRVAIAGVVKANEQCRGVEVVVLCGLRLDVVTPMWEGEAVVLDNKAEDMAHGERRRAG